MIINKCLYTIIYLRFRYVAPNLGFSLIPQATFPLMRILSFSLQGMRVFKSIFESYKNYEVIVQLPLVVHKRTPYIQWYATLLRHRVSVRVSLKGQEAPKCLILFPILPPEVDNTNPAPIPIEFLTVLFLIRAIHQAPAWIWLVPFNVFYIPSLPTSRTFWMDLQGLSLKIQINQHYSFGTC